VSSIFARLMCKVIFELVFYCITDSCIFLEVHLIFAISCVNYYLVFVKLHNVILHHKLKYMFVISARRTLRV